MLKQSKLMWEMPKTANDFVFSLNSESWRFLLPREVNGKESACQCRRSGFSPWVGKIPCSRKWQPIPVFFPGKTHGYRSLASYSPWGQRVRHKLASNQPPQWRVLHSVTLFIQMSIQIWVYPYFCEVQKQLQFYQ